MTVIDTDTWGQILKKDLGLERLQYSYIVKIIDIPINVYIIFFDSRFPTSRIPISKIKNLDTFIFGRLKVAGLGYKIKSFKITPPIVLDDFMGKISSNSVILRLDICGERFSNTNLYESVNYENFENEKIKIIEI